MYIIRSFRCATFGVCELLDTIDIEVVYVYE